MEINRDNFDDLLPEIEKGIDDCIFLAIDTELTGLNVSEEKENYFETVEERYEFVRKSGTQFLVIQFGLCPFFYSAETNQFTHKAYNFYTFPRQISSSAPNTRFLCEGSALEFLSKSAFDFNKWIYRGVPYLTPASKQRMKESLEKYHDTISSEESVVLPVPEIQKKFMETTESRIKAFIAGTDTEIKLNGLSSYQRKLIFHNFKRKYSNRLYFETVMEEEYDDDSREGTDIVSESSENVNINLHSIGDSQIDLDLVTPVTVTTVERVKSSHSEEVLNSLSKPTNSTTTRVLKITKLSPSEQISRTEKKKKEAFADIEKAVGFAKVIKKISDSGKVIVGHNMLLDVAHIIHQFVCELPEGLAEFKTLVQASLPNIIDTKYMSSSHPFRELVTSTVLFDLIQRMKEEPFKLPEIKTAADANAVGYKLNDRKKHEAGFDAFTTGACFIAMCQYLGTLQTPQKFYIMAESPLVMPFINKLYLMRMDGIAYLNISGTDLTPSRSHVFYVQCPKEATTKDIQQLFSPFGAIQTYWRNSNTLFVSLNDKDQSSFVMGNLKFGNGYKIMPFTQYQRIRREEKKRPLLNEISPERPGDIFKKLVCGDKSPDEHMKKRPKTEQEKTNSSEKTFEEPDSWN